MLAHLPQREAFDQVHVAVDRYVAVVTVLAVVLGQLFERERTLGGSGAGIATRISAAAFPVLQLPVHGRADDEEAEHQAGERDDGLVQHQMS
ncbi:MAG: hypothetical protein LC781_20855 [Actinobacteria bacterium]|nr:hypothetical protein [Actinomycetota bacterium]